MEHGVVEVRCVEVIALELDRRMMQFSVAASALGAASPGGSEP